MSTFYGRIYMSFTSNKHSNLIWNQKFFVRKKVFRSINSHHMRYSEHIFRILNDLHFYHNFHHSNKMMIFIQNIWMYKKHLHVCSSSRYKSLKRTCILMTLQSIERNMYFDERMKPCIDNIYLLSKTTWQVHDVKMSLQHLRLTKTLSVLTMTLRKCQRFKSYSHSDAPRRNNLFDTKSLKKVQQKPMRCFLLIITLFALPFIMMTFKYN